MTESPLKVWREKDGRLLRLRLNRAKANIIDAEMIAALDAAKTLTVDNHHDRGRTGQHFFDQCM